MGTLKAENIANFTSALMTGFEILQKVMACIVKRIPGSVFFLSYSTTELV